MKRIFTITVGLFLAISTFAQFSVTRADGTEYKDGDVFTFNEVGTEKGELKFIITNSTTDNIFLQLEVVDIKNADGSNAQICCFGQCFPSINKGRIFPSESTAQRIGASEKLEDGHLVNKETTPQNGAESIEYILRIYQVTDEGKPLDGGKSITFTYKYKPTASAINDLANAKYNVYPTLSNGDVVVTSESNNVTVQLFNVMGQPVKTFVVNKGQTALDLSALNEQLYFVVMRNANNKIINKTKIMIKK